MTTLRTEDFATTPDWPKPGVLFYDIGPVMRNAELLARTTAELVAASHDLVGDVDYVVAAEARGFLFGPELAVALGAGFIPARKPNKLPPETSSAEYALEYGVEQLHIHDHGLDGARILVHDDLLATGGTAAALVELMTRAGATPVGASFVCEISALDGRKALSGLPVSTLVSFD